MVRGALSLKKYSIVGNDELKKEMMISAFAFVFWMREVDCEGSISLNTHRFNMCVNVKKDFGHLWIKKRTFYEQGITNLFNWVSW